VLFVVGRDPVFVAGPGSHPDRLIALAGGKNVAHDLLSPYQQMSLEAALEREPEVIIDTSDNSADALRGRAAGSWRRWPFLPAVRNNQVYWLDPSRLVIPGIRLPAMARLMSQLIHPEVFGEPAPEHYQRLLVVDR
jgi:ABC-type Fe3+-hydroxamate transport system substrate-binding protein